MSWFSLARCHKPVLRTTPVDRKSTRLNSSHLVISYAVFCLKKKTKTDDSVSIELSNQVLPAQSVYLSPHHVDPALVCQVTIRRLHTRASPHLTASSALADES